MPKANAKTHFSKFNLMILKQTIKLTSETILLCKKVNFRGHFWLISLN